MTATETKAFLDKVAAEEAAPTGPAGEDGVATTNYAQFVAEAEALLTKAGQELPDKAVYTTDGVLDEGTYAQELITRIKAIDAGFTASAVDALAAAYPYLDFQRNPVGTGAVQVRRVQAGREPRVRRERGLLPRRPGDQADVHPDHQGRHRRWPGPGRGPGRLEVLADGPDLRRDQGRPEPEVRRVPGLRLLRPVLQPASGRERAVR